ncbi:hypothetical protein [Timonella sp. A28]|uniref:hypothetical protein n=1 Tax=Timonella sp. A28 TaxID=3442640 RepID=UPI003EBCEFCC
MEQIGSPEQLYDEPANTFVMSFLGPVTRLGNELVRPHDIEVLSSDPSLRGFYSGTVTRSTRVGFEVRSDVLVESPEFTGTVQFVVTRAEARSLKLDAGAQVWLRKSVGATGVETTEPSDAPLEHAFANYMI